MAHLVRAIFCVIALIGHPSFVYADTSQPVPDKRAELAARVDQANQLYQDQKYPEALAIYQDIYNQTKEPSMLFSMGQCYRNMQQTKKAADAYRAFLREVPQESEFRPVAQQLLTEAEATLKAEEPPKPPRSKSRALYMGALIGGAVGVAAGASALTTIVIAGNRQDDGDAEGAADLLKVADVLALTADLTSATALGLAIGGFVLSKRDTKTSTGLLLGPTQVTLTLEF